MPEFKSWPKISRRNPFEVTISEKIDGSNGCIIIEDSLVIGVQSRNRLITPEDDNFGFASWVYKNEKELIELGDGYHYGEWAGPGIQKNPHRLEKKTFFLFNTYLWNNEFRPKCCEVVPVLFEGLMTEFTIDLVMNDLLINYVEGGEPEGVVVFHHTFGKYTKHTFENTEGKWRAE